MRLRRLICAVWALSIRKPVLGMTVELTLRLPLFEFNTDISKGQQPEHGDYLPQAAKREVAAAADIYCGAPFPTTYVCPPSTSCLALAANTTTLCCPIGSSCARIVPITCDIRALDVRGLPQSPIHTLALDVDLPICGDGCCPFGYSCRDGVCIINSDQTGHPRDLAPDPTSFLGGASTSKSTQPSPTPTPNVESPALSQANAGGLIAGASIGALLLTVGSVFVFWTKFLRHRVSLKIPEQFKSWQRLHSPPSDQSNNILPNRPPRLSRSQIFSYHMDETIYLGNPKRNTAELTGPIELPATPVSFSMWDRAADGMPLRPKSRYVPFSDDRKPFFGV
jgi:hypothetical protein